MKRILIYAAILLLALSHCGCSSLLPIDLGRSIIWPLVTLVIVLAALVFFGYSGGFQLPIVRGPEDVRFTEAHITQTFIAAIPTLTQEMNLEVASSKQTETLERTDDQKLFGLDLGTNTARIAVPVTYRYYICLYETWKLHVADNTVVVCAPAIRCSIPPAIHTDEIQETVSRGWLRGGPTEMLGQLRREITPRLCEFANDPRRIDLVREKCRQSVAEFVQRWLEGESRWDRDKFTAIRVHFINEAVVPSRPTVQLMNF